jgi:hypothetical protein
MRWAHTTWQVPGAVAAGLCVAIGLAAYVSASPRVGDWREIAWPFPRDGWPAGRAFRCANAECGDGIEVYVRPKIGFCNCDTGVADDDEVDRVADLDLISEQFRPDAAGAVVHVDAMTGRSRAYTLQMADGSQRAAVGIAASRRCDLLVAAAQGKGPAPNLQRLALDLLESNEVSRWMTSAMGGR